MKKVNVEVWSDFVCPWCWVAKRRFEKAVRALADQVDVTVTSRAYRLAKGVPPMDFKSALDQKFGNPAAANGMMKAVRENALSEGLVYNFETMRFGDTSAAHTLIKSISSPSLAQKVTERLFKAATTDGLDIFDRQVLISLAKEVGVTETNFDFESQPILREIVRDEVEANRIANGVPLFLFNNKLFLSGARDAGVFERALLESAVDAPVSIDMGEGESCGIHGCSN